MRDSCMGGRSMQPRGPCSRVKMNAADSSDGPDLHPIKTSSGLVGTPSMAQIRRCPKNPASPNKKSVLTMSREQPGGAHADSNGVTKVVRTLFAINSVFTLRRFPIPRVEMQDSRGNSWTLHVSP